MEHMNRIEHRTWSIEKITDIKSLRSTLYAQRSSLRSPQHLPWKTRTVLNNKIINGTGSRIRYYKNETRKFELLQGLPGIR